MVADAVLPFIAQAITEGKVGTQAPIILKEQPGVEEIHPRSRVANRDGILRRRSRCKRCQRRVGVVSVETRGGAGGTPPQPQPAPESNRMLPERCRGVVLQLVVILRIMNGAFVIAARRERALNGNRGCCV